MILGVLQARVSSTRLPGKVLQPILGEPMIARQIERVQRATTVDALVVATSVDSSDDPLAELCARLGVTCHRGSLDDVLDRVLGAARTFGADHVVRLTGDCPLADPAVIDDVVRLHLRGGYEYTGNVNPPTFPDGIDVEVVAIRALETAWCEAHRASQREHVTLMLREHPERFSIGNLVHTPDLSALRWTVDEPSDLEFVRRIYGALYVANPMFGMDDVLRVLEKHPELNLVNQGIGRDEGLAKSLREDRSVEGGEGWRRDV
jgi:spore coat polysaccharide biosynthesis protein SpsF